MKTHRTGDALTVNLTESDTYDWANRPGNLWPHSFLSGRSVFVGLERDDIVSVCIDDGHGDQDCPADELRACLRDLTGYPRDHDDGRCPAAPECFGCWGCSLTKGDRCRYPGCHVLATRIDKMGRKTCGNHNSDKPVQKDTTQHTSGARFHISQPHIKAASCSIPCRLVAARSLEESGQCESPSGDIRAVLESIVARSESDDPDDSYSDSFGPDFAHARALLDILKGGTS